MESRSRSTSAPSSWGVCTSAPTGPRQKAHRGSRSDLGRLGWPPPTQQPEVIARREIVRAASARRSTPRGFGTVGETIPRYRPACANAHDAHEEGGNHVRPEIWTTTRFRRGAVVVLGGGVTLPHRRHSAVSDGWRQNPHNLALARRTVASRRSCIAHERDAGRVEHRN
jgi:hypothetical protein